MVHGARIMKADAWGSPREGDTGHGGVAGVGVARLMGSGPDGREGVRVTGMFLGTGCVGKMSVFAGVR